jgi:type III restriction enzyme
MLQEVIELQNTAVSRLVTELYRNNEITFKAPTGSGKTYMMADFMNRVLSKNQNIVFIVSSLSKGDLAKQNYEKFKEYTDKGNFPTLNPYLINSDISGEERLYIPTEHNVYVLPRDLYKENALIKIQGAMYAFLDDLRYTQGKFIFLIKDECHIATNNLDALSATYIKKIVNISATPQLGRGQHPNVEISYESAERAKLIKRIEWGEDTEKVGDAINKFEEIKEQYQNLLGVNPCLIIQISNKDKADAEIAEIKKELDKAEHTDLKWMLIVDKDKDCDTNDMFKAKKLPVDRWKYYAKQNNGLIDIIIFKMVITEGWDIPRACMLYQMRDTQSKQLDEQVIGRVRRNPRLLDFENLSSEAQELAMTAWVWGIQPKDGKKILGVKLWKEPEDITNNIKIKTTKLKPLTDKKDFDIDKFLASQTPKTTHKNIFELGRKLRATEPEVKKLIYSYSTDYTKWREATEFLEEIEKESNQFYNDYTKSMEIGEDVSFALVSYYTDNGNYLNIGNWVWKRREDSTKFAFDSEAERGWAEILKDLSATDTAKTTVGKLHKNKNAGTTNLWGKEEKDVKLEEKEICLWGKNYVGNSEIKFEYYMGAKHTSFPDFVVKDKHGRIHIFEVKSVNQSGTYTFDNNIYKAKVAELKKCYKQASKLTNQIFYLPVIDQDVWQITRFEKGNEDTLTQSQFETFIGQQP